MTQAGEGDLVAVIFDVDGTLVESERHGHRVAFNLAFQEFDLPYRWSEEEYGELLRTTGGRRRIDGYLVGQGVPEAERERLVPALHDRKTEIMKELVREGRVDLRPGARRLLDELQERGCLLAVATTGSRGWIDGLLEQLVEGIPFDVVVTGDEVENRKPDPEAFTTAVERLGVEPGAVVVVEDSGEGVNAAAAAGLPCAAVVNGYTADHDLSAAGLVLDGFGDPDDPATVVSDRAGTGCSGVLDAAVLERLVGTS